MLRRLSFIPLPLRILAGVLILVLLAGAIGGSGGSSGGGSGGFGRFFLPVALLGWAVVIATLLYEFGWLNAVSRIPGLSHFFGFMSNRAAAASRPATGTEQASRAELGEADRRRLATEGMAQLNALIGIEDARDQILQRVIEPSSDDNANPFGVQAPALVVAFAGPQGVGKTTAAMATARILAGRGALGAGHVVAVREVDLRSGSHGSAAALATAKAQQAVGGMLLIEDAGWLMAADAYGGPGPGADFGQGLLDVIQRHPHRILVAMTLTSDEAAGLMQRPEIARWLSKLSLRSIHFDDLPDEALLELMETRLDAAGWELADDDAATAARRMLSDLRTRAGAGFDNAEACRRAAETLVEIARSEGDETARRDRLIGRTIVRIADDQLE